MIRLYNHTKHPDGPMRDVLTYAARAIGVKGDVCVKVTRSLCPRPRAYAARGFPYSGFMWGAGDCKGRNSILLGNMPGFVVMSLPNRLTRPGVDWLAACWWFMKTALHEMAHVFQFRENIFWKLEEAEKRQASGRRQAHDRRPCEIDAENRKDNVLADRRRFARCQELAIALADAIEFKAWVEKLFDEARPESTGAKTRLCAQSRSNSGPSSAASDLPTDTVASGRKGKRPASIRNVDESKESDLKLRSRLQHMHSNVVLE
jgi:hypothetical protein